MDIPWGRSRGDAASWRVPGAAAAQRGSSEGVREAAGRRRRHRKSHASAAGDPAARCELGARYSEDVGVGQRRDAAQATAWYKLAAEGGHANAQHNYAVSLERTGQRAEALVWYEKAADSGLPSAVFALGQLWYTGFHNAAGRFVRDVDKALAYFERSAEAGYLPAAKFVERAKCEVY